MSTILFATLMVLGLGTNKVLSEDPCKTGSRFIGDERRSVEYSKTTGGFCDSYFVPGWYRLQVPGFDVDLATSPPAKGACNTDHPIWLKGTVPATTDMETVLTACVVDDNTCTVQLPVKVINCGLYRVYNLVPATFCLAAYCFDLSLPCPDGTSSETGFLPNCTSDFPQVDIKPNVVPLTEISEDDRRFKDLRFVCLIGDFPNAASLHFDVVWRINGDEVARFKNKPFLTLLQSTQLKETHWKPQGYRLGMNVQCGIRARLFLNSVPSPESPSEVFFAGLKVLQTIVEVTEGETAHVGFQATVPIPCPVSSGTCAVVFLDKTYESIDVMCIRGNLTSGCGFTISSDKWTEVHKLELVAEYDRRYGDRYADILLRSENPWSVGDSVWAGVVPQKVKVTIKDSDAKAARSTCRINSDPHIKTFGGRWYDVHLPGEFVLYRHKALPLEVRGFFQACYGRRVTCPCGVAIQSGSQIFVHSKCEDNLPGYTRRTRLYVHEHNGCTRRQMTVLSDRGGFKVEVSSGLEVKIHSNGNIQIRPSTVDVNQVQGLCGNFDGNSNYDLIAPDGTNYGNTCSRYCENYGRLWRITDRKDSFYAGNPERVGVNIIGRCTCTKASQGSQTSFVECSNAPPIRCLNHDQVITEDRCTQLTSSNQGRRKRAALIDDDEEEPVFPILPDPHPAEFQEPEWTNGWSEEKARQHCETHFQKSPAFVPCSEVQNLDLDNTILNCVADIKLTGDTEWTAVSLETFKEDCLSEVNRNTTLWKSEGDQKSVYHRVVESVCSNECNSRGRCVMGHCECSSNWLGDDCSVDGTNPPVVLEINNRGLCNMDNKDCSQAVVFGTYFARVPSLKCHFVQVYVTEDIERTVKDPYVTLARFRGPTEIVCSLPESAEFGRVGKNHIAYMVSVSNVNDKFGPAKLFLPYRSGDCRKTGDEFTCGVLPSSSNLTWEQYCTWMFFLSM